MVDKAKLYGTSFPLIVSAWRPAILILYSLHNNSQCLYIIPRLIRSATAPATQVTIVGGFTGSGTGIGTGSPVARALYNATEF